MSQRQLLFIGSGHLAFRTQKLARDRGCAVTHLADDAIRDGSREESSVERIAHLLDGIDLDELAGVYLVDSRDERNLELLIGLISLDRTLPIVVCLFNENIAPHLRAAHPNIQVLNPARIAASAFVAALDTPVTRTLRYTPAQVPDDPRPAGTDRLIAMLLAFFVALVAVATTFFHFAEHISWVNALYFVVVTVSTVGYGDITLVNSPTSSKLVAIALILASTAFMWLIFSLTVDRIIKRRVQTALGRRKYSRRDHVIMCGLGRLGYFIAEGLLARGEKVLIIERDEDSAKVQHFRSLGADVYVGDARLPGVLQDVGVTRAKALYSVIDDDYANLEIGLNARSVAPTLRLVLRIFDESMSRKIRENLDIQLTFSMTAIAREIVLDATGVHEAQG